MDQYKQSIRLIDEIRAEINFKLEMWKEVLESRRFKLSTTKIEYMEFKFINGRQRSKISNYCR